MGDPIQQFIHWYRGKSIVSKLYFTSSLLMFILLYFTSWITVNEVYLDMLTLQDMQLWRLWTALIYQNGFSILAFVVKFYISYSIIVNLEEIVFGRDTVKNYSDFLWIVGIAWIYVNIFSVYFNFLITNHFFFMCLCCIWYQKKPNSSQNIVFGLTIPISYARFAYAIYMWIIGVHLYWAQILLAFALGYVYYFLKVYSMTHWGKDYFRTPKIFELMVEKYLILQKRLGLVQGYFQEQEQEDDPYGKYGYYSNNNQ